MIAWLLAAALSASSVDELARAGAAAYPTAPTIDIASAKALDGALWLDVRSSGERAVSMIDGAIAEQDLPADLGARPVVVYCTIGVRSGAATLALRRRGIEAYNLYGGVLGWAQAGGTFRDPSGAVTRRVHVYGAAWNRLPEGYEAVLR